MTSVTLQSKTNLIKQIEAKPPPQQQQQPEEVASSSNNDKYSQFKLDKERDEFVHRLVEFHRHKNVNTPLISWPTLNGRAVDLYKLFTRVLSLGGWESVCEKDRWNDIGEYIDKANLSACTNGVHALRLIYIRYLSMFEKFIQTVMSNTSTTLTSLISDTTLFQSALNNFHASSTNLGQQLTSSASMLSMSGSVASSLKDKSLLDDKSDELALISKRKFSYLIDSTSMTYNYHQHFTDTALNNTATSKLNFNPYEKLEISLVSGLPNEVDFVFNTILLLSSDEYHSFRIYLSPNLLNLMLAHIGFFGSEESSYRHLYDTVWNSGTIRRNFVKFWHNSIQAPVSVDDECYDDNYESSNLNKLITSLLPKLYNQYLKTLPAKELLNLDEITNENESKLVHSNHSESVEFRRIEQVMVTLNNLSFEENNAEFLANKSNLLLEFLVMCIYCTGSHVELKKHALDILSNLSRKIKLKLLDDKHARLLLMSLSHLIVGSNTNKIDEDNPVKEFYDDQTQDRLEIIKGLEILTKLCSQQIDPCLTSVDYANESILSQYCLNEMTGALFLNKILVRLEQLLTVQDIFLLINTLECLYHMSQFSEAICNLIVSYTSGLSSSSPKLVSMLINFLTIDMTHFGLSNDNKQNKLTSQNMKIYKISNSTNNNIPNNYLPQQQQQQQQQSIVINNNHNTNKSNNQNNLTSLLHQTLNNQHQINTTPNHSSTVSALLSSKANSSSLNSNSVQRITTTSSNTTTTSTISTSQEQQAKSVLCNWLRTCFQIDASSEISKTKLYPYYQQIAKMNNWNILTIPTFFEILNATFPNLRYNDATNQIVGLKLVVNVKQQLQLKKEELIQQAESDWPQLPSNVNNVKIKATGPLINTMPSSTAATTATTTTTIPQTTKSTNQNGHAAIPAQEIDNTKKTESDTTNSILPANKLPTALTTINVITPSILPLLTPPTPPPQPGTQTDENLNNTLTNGNSNSVNTNTNMVTNNTLKQTSKLLNDTSNVNKTETNETQTNVNEKKFEKIISKSDDTCINNLERKIANNENNLKQTNGINNNNTDHSKLNGNLSSEEKTNLVNGNKHVSLTNGHTNNHSCSSSDSSVSSDDEQEEETNKMVQDLDEEEDEEDDDDGQIESFRKRKHDEPVKESPVKNSTTKSDENDSSETKKSNEQKEETKSIDNTSPVKKQKLEENMTTNGEHQPQQINSVNSNPIEVVPPSNTNVSVPTPPPSALTPIATPSPAPVQGGDYICEWNNCKMAFNSVKSIYNHVCKYHLLNTDTHLNSNGSLCLWIGCDQIRRQKWSLVNHIQERHCNENALKCAIMYRQRGLVPVSSNTNQAILNYAKDAAFIAIQKNQKKSIEEFVSIEEGPVSKTIRLLSALILRNLARNSDKAKSILKSHESVLTDIAFDLLESSNVLANCLWHLSN